MKFGEKLKALRLERNLSQKALADLTGITVRTIQNYETTDMLPKKRDTYDMLAKVLAVDVSELMGESEDFILNAGEQYGSRGARQAQAILDQVNGLYAGGELSEEDMDAFMFVVQQAYLDAKMKNRKYAPGKAEG